jgi:hypothetical protein
MAPKLAWFSGNVNALCMGGQNVAAALKYPAQQAPRPNEGAASSRYARAMVEAAERRAASNFD